MYKAWTKEEVKKLIFLFKQKNKSYTDISNELGRSYDSVQRKFSNLGLKRDPNAFNEIYSLDFCSMVYESVKQIGVKETCLKMGLGRRQVEHLVRRHKKYNGIAKTEDNERFNSWKTHETLFLLSYIGLKPLSFISQRLGRTESAIASYVKRRGFRLNYVNGLPKETFDEIFKVEGFFVTLRTTEGKVIVPWVSIAHSMEKLKITDFAHIRSITAMANLQKFIHGKKTNEEVLEELWVKIEE